MKVQSLCKQLGATACLAFCYGRAATEGYGGSEKERDLFLIKRIVQAEDVFLVDKEFHVLDADKLIHFINPLVAARVTKKIITSLDDIKEYEFVAVNFRYGKNNHWVLVHYGKIYFNSLDYSQSVALGTPVEARIIYIKEAA
ncbi:hypothetical protein [Treponema sp.]|uniref:hypothetical protein n=1 Tax=Treponema sp. TaxID=166 RepID=UPI0025F94A18|nr:hypothetical protein [Treponema sp.]MCR5219187.1 hypothetical protein [Treponema sp.]